MPRQPQFSADIAEEIWNLKYRLKAADGMPIDQTLDDTFWRVANAAASAEKDGKGKRGAKKTTEAWAKKFHSAISDFGFLPAGRIIAGAGTNRNVTLFNCFVMGRIPDDLSGIFDAVKQAALTMQAGGGIGHDFSTLRPRGALVKSIGADASGPVSFMDVWDAMCRTIMSAGARRGAMMATMRVDHPDIEDFIAAKQDPGRLRNFNLSVLVSDAFMAAVHGNTKWDLTFDGTVYRTVDARALWDSIIRATYEYAEPGVIFIDRINRANNLNYCEEIFATNPCGEQPLPSYGACLLGSINLTKLVAKPFETNGDIAIAALEERTRTAVRFLDNIIDVSAYPLKKQKREAKTKRRIGLGITGLADALIMAGRRYDSLDGRRTAERWMAAIQNAAYEASIELASEKGTFPAFHAEEFLKAPNVERLEKSTRKALTKHGIRNGCLTSIAPTGTISLFAGNISSGIEPVFDFQYQRRLLAADGSSHQETVEDYAHALYRETFASNQPLPDTFVRAEKVPADAHLAMQAALQPHVDSAISKTINCPKNIAFDEFKDIYSEAYRLGLKGCTTYRPNDVTGAVLSHSDDADTGVTTQDAATSVTPVSARHVASTPAKPDNGPDGIVYMTEPLARTEALDGSTYKLKWPAGDQAIYITINDITQDGRRRPFEIFINTRNLEHYAWTVALTRMISAVFRRGGDVSFVAEELKAIFDPQGGCWIGGRYVPSLLAAIGSVIENHMRKIGFLTPDKDLTQPKGNRAEATISNISGGPVEQPTGATGASTLQPPTTGAAGTQAPTISPIEHSPHPSSRSSHSACPKCGAANLVHQEGCLVCRECGFSKCS